MLRFLPWRLLAAACIVAAIVLAGYVLSLDREVRRQFDGRRWNLPAQVYARPLELYAGLAISADDLQRELTSLGYTRVNTVRLPGSYSRSGGRIELITRPFQFWDAAQPARRAVAFFGSAGLMDLAGEHGATLPLLRLDPPFLGNIFATHGEDRVVLRPEQVPQLLLTGLKVVEDRSFDQHIGISLKAIARAALVNLRSGAVQQGGSTLTQQLVRSYFLSNERTLIRKLREAIMAVLLELHFDKPDLLNAYVNEIYLGQAGDRAIHGFGLAARFYFGKPLEELEAQEIALLIAIVRGPSYYDPRRNPERALQRRNMVLELMATYGALDEAAARRALQKDLGVRSSATAFASYNPAFMDLVRRELQTDYAEDDLLNSDLRVLTNLDPRIQAAAERRLNEGLKSLEQSRKLAAGTLDGAIVVTGTQTPDIVAVVGGRNTRIRGFNRALDARRPIGSLVKPVVYLAGLETGRYHAASILLDEPLTLTLPNRKTWTPRNYDREFRGPVPAVRALAESLNVPTVRLGMDVGPARVASLLGRLGMAPAPAALPSLLLGAVAQTPLEVAQVYNSLATGGFRAPLKAVRAVLDAEGQPLERYSLNIERVADPTAVAQLNTMLIEVVERGTARPARRWLPPQMRFAGKTGTSDDLRDSWFAGFTSDHVVVAWVGADNNAPTGLSGAAGALPIWARLVADLHDRGYEPETAPNLVPQAFDFATGLAADGFCGDLVMLPLPAGTELPLKPGCGLNLAVPLQRGVQWLQDLLN